MAERKSLLDDSGFDKIGARGGGAKPRGQGGGDRTKLIVAIALFLIAGGLVGWQAGLFDFSKAKGGGTTQLTPEEVKSKSDQDKVREIESTDKTNTRGES